MTIGKEWIMQNARLKDKQKRLEDLNHKAENYIIILRDIIDPSVDDSNDLNLYRAKLTLEDFIALNDQKLALKAEIAKIERDLRG
jgi:hypothetical protein